ncbi:MAG: rhomboid family intramembrane serine protease [Saprospiraceae bacterium]
MPRITDVAKNLLIINVMFFLASLIFGDAQMNQLMALHYFGSEYFMPLQLATHFFMHGGFAHIFFNMFALVMFGSALETMWGPKKFLFFYFACAIGAAVLHIGFTAWEIGKMQELAALFDASPSASTMRDFLAFARLDNIPENQDMLASLRKGIPQDQAAELSLAIDGIIKSKMDIPMVGASGAIYGLLLGFGMLFPNAELMLLFFPVPIKAKYFIPGLMVIELYLGMNQYSWDNIAHFAHLGGALTGFLIILYWRKFGSPSL